MTEKYNPTPSSRGGFVSVGYPQRRQRRAQTLLQLKGGNFNGGGGSGDDGGCRKGLDLLNSNTLFHTTSTKRSRVVMMKSELLGDRLQAVHDKDIGLGIGLGLSGGAAIRKNVGSGGDGEVLQSEAARAYYEKKKEALREEEKGRTRDLCDRCRRAQRVSWSKCFIWYHT